VRPMRCTYLPLNVRKFQYDQGFNRLFTMCSYRVSVGPRRRAVRRGESSMMTPSDRACGDARAKMEAVILSLRVMRAGLAVLEEQIDQTVATVESELKQADARAYPEDPVLANAGGDNAPERTAETTLSSCVASPPSERVDPAVGERADGPALVGTCLTAEATICEEKMAVGGNRDANADLFVAAFPPSTDHKVESPCSAPPVSLDAGGDAEATVRGSTVVTLLSRRRRMLTNVAASVAAALVLVAMVVATKLDTLDGFTSLARATGLR